MSQNCLNCGQALLAGASFCRNCGTRAQQPNICSRCGASNQDGTPFCSSCGTALQQAPAPQQQPASVAFRVQNKWLLPGFGGALAIIAVMAFMLFAGGSDSPQNQPPPANLARSVIPPTKVASTSEDLASTISTLNKAQLNVMSRTTSTTPVEPKLIDQGLQDVAADAMRVAEMANIMSQTAMAQASAPEQSEAAGKAAQQYDAIAQTAYAQLVEAQNLRVQLAQGQVALPQITQSISNYGAQMWNTGVTISGRPGNPFEPFLQGTPQVEISINLSTTAARNVTVQIAPGLSGWVALSGATYSRPVTINLVPAPAYDPLDPDLLLWMLTYDGQADPYFAQRYALSRLEQYRRGLRTDRIGITSLVGSNWTDVVIANERANGRYVNMYDLPDWGTMGINFLLPRGIAVSELAQLQAGIIPSFRGGYGLGYALQGTSAQELALLGLALNGTDVPSLLTTMFMTQAQSYAALGIAGLQVIKYTPGFGLNRGTVDVAFSLFAESILVDGLNVRCNGVPAQQVGANTVRQFNTTLPASQTGTLSCEMGVDSAFSRIPAFESVTFPAASPEEIDKANKEKDAAKKYWDEQRKKKLDEQAPLSVPLPPVVTSPAEPVVTPPPPPLLPPPPQNRYSCPAIKGTQYLSGEEADWYRGNCNTPLPQVMPQVKANPSTSNVAPSTTHTAAAKPQPAAAVQPAVQQGVAQPPIQGGANPAGVIQSLQQPQHTGPVVRAPMPQGNTNSGGQHTQPAVIPAGTNNPNLNNNRADCIAITASGYYIPGGAELAWFNSFCKARPCNDLKSVPFANQTSYERWLVVNKCPASPATQPGHSSGGNPPSTSHSASAPKPAPFTYNFDTLASNLDLPGGFTKGWERQVCFGGSVTVTQGTKKTQKTAAELGMSIAGFDIVGPDGCLKTTFSTGQNRRIYPTKRSYDEHLSGSFKITVTALAPCTFC